MSDTNALSTMLAMPFQLTQSYTATLTDASHAGTSIVFNPSGSVWYRTFLATTSGTGADDTVPKELLAYVQGVLAGLWTVKLTAAGKVAITYTGSGTGTINWGTGGASAQAIARELGFTGNVGPLVKDATATATNAPRHCILAWARLDDAGWSASHAHFAASVTGTGRVDALFSRYQLVRRSFGFRFLPRTPADATALGATATPYWPNDVADTQWLTPSTSPTTNALQWSAHELLSTGYGVALGVTLGDLQALIAGTLSPALYDAAYLDPETRKGKAQHSTATFKGRVDRPGVVLNLFRRELRA